MVLMDFQALAVVCLFQLAWTELILEQGARQERNRQAGNTPS